MYNHVNKWITEVPFKEISVFLCLIMLWYIYFIKTRYKIDYGIIMPYNKSC